MANSGAHVSEVQLCDHRQFMFTTPASVHTDVHIRTSQQTAVKVIAGLSRDLFSFDTDYFTGVLEMHTDHGRLSSCAVAVIKCSVDC